MEFPAFNIDLDEGDLLTPGNKLVERDQMHANRGDVRVRPIINPTAQSAKGWIILHEQKFGFAVRVTDRRLMDDDLREGLGKLLRKVWERFEGVVPAPGEIATMCWRISPT